MSEAVNDGPLLTIQNPADMVGETVIDCRPSVLPVSMPLSALSPRTVDNEDELPTPTSSLTQNVALVIPPTETADSLDRGASFNLDLAKVMLDVSVMPALISPIEESEVPPMSAAAEYAAPETPVLETVIESPGYAVPGS